jgi:hypothetical protein
MCTLVIIIIIKLNTTQGWSPLVIDGSSKGSTTFALNVTHELYDTPGYCILLCREYIVYEVEVHRTLNDLGRPPSAASYLDFMLASMRRWSALASAGSSPA